MSLRSRPRTRARVRTPARVRTRAPVRRAAVLLLLAGLLLTAPPCAHAGGGHHRAAGPVAAAAQRPERADMRTPVLEAVQSDGPHTACGPGPSGQLPKGRADGSGAPPTAPVTASGTVPPPSVRRRAAPDRPPRTGRTTLAVLCRCRI
ncbi:hypothetical protein [Streptomyces natalensis]|uniref:Secreted protein n=1 Tax=Streptomyces natalensis ATCC 27448 TaxID=1240678 RepID=A0A0D7CH99_9ACTN|nr:hypothetical protein [Streptomyces natalensis]KIZ14772.1 hypothetical protein SNA_30280 [Streptomyces natalensis ATCC 27448]